ncbi:hypothetical protein [Methylobacterium sp. AMS5]|uniref:hypothetical protein n=1 Tax=Methylobacterium sp. AMS5 TaxID=925818 RepID=UPI0011875EE2|nr:hypothetical protein [Methylobacterium sp. AMS5]
MSASFSTYAEGRAPPTTRIYISAQCCRTSLPSEAASGRTISTEQRTVCAHAYFRNYRPT